MNSNQRDSRFDGKPIPENLPEELLPLYDWWTVNGQKFIICLAVGIIAIAGFYAFKNYRNAKATAVNTAVLQAQSVEDLEIAVSENGSAKGGNALRIRLAKAYFDAGKYEDALRVYDECLAKGSPEGFEEIVTLGRAYSLEALGKNDEALAIYRKFQKDNAKSFLILKAQFGEARALALSGKKDEAKAFLEELKVSLDDDAAAVAAIDNLSKLIERYTPRAKRSLFELSEDIVKKDAAVVPELAPAAAPKADAAKTATNAPAVKK